MLPTWHQKLALFQTEKECKRCLSLYNECKVHYCINESTCWIVSTACLLPVIASPLTLKLTKIQVVVAIYHPVFSYFWFVSKQMPTSRRDVLKWTWRHNENTNCIVSDLLIFLLAIVIIIPILFEKKKQNFKANTIYPSHFYKLETQWRSLAILGK